MPAAEQTESNDSNGSTDSDSRDGIFRYQNEILKNRDLLDISHVPGENRIVSRDEEIKAVASAVNPAIFGDPPTHVLIYGKTGTGKTLVSKHVVNRLKKEAANENIEVALAAVDCGAESSETEVVKKLANKLNTENSGVDIPVKGISTNDYYERLYKIIDQQYDVAFLLLDEIDMLPDDEILRKISRAGENENVIDSQIGIIGMSNRLDYGDTLSSRVDSSFGHDELVFDPYDANELQKILRNRIDAFHDGVLTDDVIPLCSALAAQEHGDARRAIDFLLKAGRKAEKEGASEVTEQHVRDAKHVAEMSRFKRAITGFPSQRKATLLALAVLSEQKKEDQFTAGEVYNQYQEITDRIEMDQVSERQMRKFLEDQKLMRLVNAQKGSRGYGRGRDFNKYSLLEDPKVVYGTIMDDSRFAELEGSPTMQVTTLHDYNE